MDSLSLTLFNLYIDDFTRSRKVKVRCGIAINSHTPLYVNDQAIIQQNSDNL